jgi:hypothetical protein
MTRTALAAKIRNGRSLCQQPANATDSGEQLQPPDRAHVLAVFGAGVVDEPSVEPRSAIPHERVEVLDDRVIVGAPALILHDEIEQLARRTELVLVDHHHA